MSRPRVLRVNEQAEDELAEIWAFIASDNPAAATAFVHRLRERFEPLLVHPEMGASRDMLSPGLRVFFTGTTPYITVLRKPRLSLSTWRMVRVTQPR
ncbi:MAG: type II toxin-antitoxin system RelE/ParE family toxin [Alphaproteobacteria bacterium]|nr:type II toxin-antitoxin system RelE/ParE family toxin [Alphaproteobacteria bacterium]